MSRMLFVNLPVTDLAKSIEFFSRLGFTFNQQFSNDTGTCLVLSDSAFVMLLTRDYFATFSNTPVADPAVAREAILAISAESRAEVDTLCDEALELGAAPARDPLKDDWFYLRSFLDLDGHLWEVAYMDPAALEA